MLKRESLGLWRCTVTDIPGAQNNTRVAVTEQPCTQAVHTAIAATSWALPELNNLAEVGAVVSAER